MIFQFCFAGITMNYMLCKPASVNFCFNTKRAFIQKLVVHKISMTCDTITFKECVVHNFFNNKRKANIGFLYIVAQPSA